MSQSWRLGPLNLAERGVSKCQVERDPCERTDRKSLGKGPVRKLRLTVKVIVTHDEHDDIHDVRCEYNAEVNYTCA